MTEDIRFMYLNKLGIPEQLVPLLNYGAVLLLVSLFALLATWAVRRRWR